MILEIFSVKDRATDLFGAPMFMVSSGQAVRSFSDEVNRQAADNQLYQHPDDFDLYSMGSFDQDSGLFITDAPKVVIRGKDVSTNYREAN